MALVEDAQGHISESHASAYLGDLGGSIYGDVLEAFQIDDHTTTLTAQAERGVRMASTLGLDLDVALTRAHDGIRDMLGRCWQNNDGRSVWKP